MRTIGNEQSPRLERAKPPRLAGTFLVSGFTMAALGSSRPLIPLIALSLGASSLLIGVAAALFTAAPMLLSVPFGWWMDRTGTLPTIMLSATMIVLTALLYGVMPIFMVSITCFEQMELLQRLTQKALQAYGTGFLAGLTGSSEC